MTQPSLFEPPKPQKPDRPLTERQQFVLELVQQAGRDGLTPDDVGAHLCALKSRHTIEERCEWCSANGRDVLIALRNHGKVKSRRSGQWYALDGVVEPEREETRPGHGIPF